MIQRAPSGSDSVTDLSVLDVAVSMQVRVDFLENRHSQPSAPAERFTIGVGEKLFAGVDPPDGWPYVRKFVRFFDHLSPAEFPGNYFQLSLEPYSVELHAKEGPRHTGPFRVYVDGERRTPARGGFRVFADMDLASRTTLVVDVEARRTSRVVRFTATVTMGEGQRRKTKPESRAFALLLREHWARKRLALGTNDIRLLCECLAWMEAHDAQTFDPILLEQYLRVDRQYDKRRLNNIIEQLVETLYVWISLPSGRTQTLSRFPVYPSDWNAALRVLDLAQICVATDCLPVTPATDRDRFYSKSTEVSTLLAIAIEVHRHELVEPHEVSELLSRRTLA